MGSIILTAVPVNEADLDEFNAAVRHQVIDETRLLAERRTSPGQAKRHRGNIADRLDAHLEELNKDNNGEIEPDEVADRSLRYIRFIDTNKDATVSRKKLSRSMVLEVRAE